MLLAILAFGALPELTKKNVIGEVLYNGIQLPEAWPPKSVRVEHLLDRRLPTPPYLNAPPAVINISVGRQLFIDTFLELWSNATRTFHPAVFAAEVLSPLARETAHLRGKTGLDMTHKGNARPFSGGVWYDDSKRRFVMFYRCLHRDTRFAQGCVAYSSNGVNWQRPLFNRPGSSARMQYNDRRKLLPNAINVVRAEAFTVILDASERDGSWRRWRMATALPTHIDVLGLYESRDGENWRSVGQSGVVADRASFFYNPFRRTYTASLRENQCKGGHGNMRTTRFAESREFANFTWTRRRLAWKPPSGRGWIQSYFQCRNSSRYEPVHWNGVDAYDCPIHPELPLAGITSAGASRCDLYALDASPYESLIVGQFAVLFPIVKSSMCKSTRMYLAFTRDGFHWSRTTPRTPAVVDPLGLEYMQPVAGNFIVLPSDPTVADTRSRKAKNNHSEVLAFFYGGARCTRCNIGETCTWGDRVRDGAVDSSNSSMMDATVLAILRRDGFASVGPSRKLGELTHAAPVVLVTRALAFSSGSYLFLNIDAARKHASVRVRVYARSSSAVPILSTTPHTSIFLLSDLRRLGMGRELLVSERLHAINRTSVRVTWMRNESIAPLARTELHILFELRAADLYAFWVSTDGSSNGYVSGPQYAHGRDSTPRR